jgi:hypothetical protein
MKPSSSPAPGSLSIRAAPGIAEAPIDMIRLATEEQRRVHGPLAWALDSTLP